MSTVLFNAYRALFIARFKPTLTALLLLVLAACWFVPDFRIDASSDSLVSQDDPALLRYEESLALFGPPEFLLLTWAPVGDEVNNRLFSLDSLAQLREFETQLSAIAGVAQVLDLYDAILLNNPPVTISELADNIKTLHDPAVDVSLAGKELTQSPLFRDLLISADGNITAFQINLEPNAALENLIAIRHAATAAGHWHRNDEQQYQESRAAHDAARAQLISEVRHVAEIFAHTGDVHIVGLPLIAHDMVHYVQRDLYLFGGVILVVIALVLLWLFRSARWVTTPLVLGALTTLFVIGLLGALQWPVTVVSSNFVAVLMITAISLSVHLIVRYRQTSGSQLERLAHTLRSKAAPSFCTTITTMAAFLSLTASDIPPIKDFGAIMAISIAMTLLVVYLAFACLVRLWPDRDAQSFAGVGVLWASILSRIATRRPIWILVLSVVACSTSIWLATGLSLDSRFAEYFHRDSDIATGLRYVDKHLGGTAPLDILIEFPPMQQVEAEDEFFTESESDPEKYWYTREIFDETRSAHEWLAAQPGIGKVMSLESLHAVARTLNNEESLTSVELAFLYGEIPEQIRVQFINTLAHPSSGTVRLTTRLEESLPNFDRGKILAQITDHFEQSDLFRDRVQLTGMSVLFERSLERLLDSQIATIGYVLAVTGLLFLWLFRSAFLAVAGLLPNIVAACCVFGIMRLTGQSLDFMTITIAAIVVGIGVDDAIHYLHHFRLERAQGRSVLQAIRRSHQRVGPAMVYTTMIVTAGFIVLLMSSFVPTVQFGLLTAIAMILALLANLTILPAILITGSRFLPKQTPNSLTN